VADDRRLILFVRLPEPGRVKTRLAASLGPERAAALYRAMAGDCLDVARRSGAPLTVACDPPGREADVAAWLGPGPGYAPQEGEGLGERMARAFARAFTAGAGRVLLMGSDAPDVPPGRLDQAFALLGARPAVLAPSPDGGFWCVGFAASAWRADVFADLPWSSSGTLAALLVRLRSLGLDPALLPPWPDVDTPEDLQALVGRLSGARDAAPRTRILLLPGRSA